MHKEMTIPEAIEECIRIRDELKYTDDCDKVVFTKQKALELLINYAENGEDKKKHG